MGGIRELIGLHFIMDTNKKVTIESLLANKRRIPKEKLLLLKEIFADNLEVLNQIFRDYSLGNEDINS